jgi:hypothetical protein
MNFSTTPPYLLITVRVSAKYLDCNSRTSSGSRASASAVNPTRSQNSTEHTRRSATTPQSGLAPDAADCTDPAPVGSGPVHVSALPQARQNRLPGTAGSPHDGHAISAAPQSPQNRSPAGCEAPQFAHRTTAAL